MKNKKYIKLCMRELAKLKLNKDDYNNMAIQIHEVVSEYEGDLINAFGNPSDFVKEILEMNDISSDTSSIGLPPGKIFDVLLGIVIVLIGIAFLTLPFEFKNVIFLIPTTILIWIGFKALKHGSYLTAVILLFVGLHFVSVIFGFNVFHFNKGLIPILVSLILIAIGLKFIFGKKRIQRQYYNNNHRHHSHSHAHRHKKPESDSKQDGETLIITNKVGDMSKSFTDEKISTLVLNNKVGDMKLDLSNFEFNKKELVIDVNNYIGSINVLIGAGVKVLSNIKTIGASTDIYTKDISDYKYIIKLEGNNKYGSVVIK